MAGLSENSEDHAEMKYLNKRSTKNTPHYSFCLVSNPFKPNSERLTLNLCMYMCECVLALSLCVYVRVFALSLWVIINIYKDINI